jgi:hypothetical protein
VAARRFYSCRIGSVLSVSLSHFSFCLSSPLNLLPFLYSFHHKGSGDTGVLYQGVTDGSLLLFLFGRDITGRLHSLPTYLMLSQVVLAPA